MPDVNRPGQALLAEGVPARRGDRIQEQVGAHVTLELLPKFVVHPGVIHGGACVDIESAEQDDVITGLLRLKKTRVNQKTWKKLKVGKCLHQPVGPHGPLHGVL